MSQQAKLRYIFTIGLSVFLFTPVLPVNAQLLEEVVVTAQRREQSMQDVGISVIALNAETLAKFSITDSQDLIRAVPNLNINMPAGEGNKTAFTLRGAGLNASAEFLESAVAVYQDDAYISSTSATAFGMYDIESVEVLRGPQGTLFGRNSTGGLVHFHSRQPTDEFEAYLNVRAGEYDSWRVEGAVSGALSDNLSARLSGLYNRNDGWLENLIGPDNNETDMAAVRGQIQWNLSSNVTLHLMGSYGENKPDVAPAFETRPVYVPNNLFEVLPVNVDANGTGPGNDRTGFRDQTSDVHVQSRLAPVNQDSVLDVETFSGRGKLDWQISDELTLEIITAGNSVEKFLIGPGDGPFNPLDQFTFAEADQFSQEVRLAWEREQVRMQGGVYYFTSDQHNEFSIDFRNNFGSTGAPVFGLSNIRTGIGDLERDSWSIFGQFEYDISDTFTFIGGLRYYEETQKYDNITASHNDPGVYAGFVGSVLNENGLSILGGAFNPAFAAVRRNDFDNVTVRAELDWRINDDVLAYVSFNRGVKPGAFNQQTFFNITDLARSSAETPYGEEKLHAFEIGFKSTLMDGRARLNASAFYYDYQDFQTRQFLGFASSTGNVDAEIYGVEGELTAQLTDALFLNINASIMDGETKDIFFTEGPLATTQFRDTKVPNISDFAISGLITYTVPLAQGGQLDFTLTGQYKTEIHFESQNRPAQTQDDYGLINLRAGWTSPSGKYELGAFVDNVTNEDYCNFIGLVTAIGVNQCFPGKPQWFGGYLNLQY